MRQLKLTLLFFSALTGSVYAQESYSFNLKQCIDYALANSPALKSDLLEIEKARADVGSVRSVGIPQISGQADLIHNYKIQRTFIPANAFNPNASANEIQTLQFGVPYQGYAAINANWLILDGSYIVGLKAANTYKELSLKQYERSKEETVAFIMKAYYNVLINEERTKSFKNNLNQIDSLLRNTEALYQNGFAEKIDYDRIKVNRNNLKTESDKFNNLNELGLQLLKFQIGMPMTNTLKVSESLADYDASLFKNEGIEYDYEFRSDYRVLKTQQRLAKLDVTNNQVKYLPSISAFASLGTVTGAIETARFFHFNKQWFDFGAVGLRLQLPIFDGLKKSYDTQKAKLNYRQTELGFKALSNSIDLQVAQAKSNYENSIASLENQMENRELAKSVYEVTKLKFQEGVGSNIEVIEAENTYLNSEINYYSSFYETLVAIVDLQLAKGTLLNQ